MRYEPGRGLRNRDRHLRRLADSAEHLGFRFDLPRSLDALRSRLRSSTRRGSGCWLPRDRNDRRRRGGAARRPAGARPPRARRRTGRPVRAVAPPQDDPPRPLRPSPPAATRGRRRHHGQHSAASSPRSPGPPSPLERRRDRGGHHPPDVRLPAGGRAGPPARPRPSCTSGCCRRTTWTAEALAVISSLRGWRDARLLTSAGAAGAGGGDLAARTVRDVGASRVGAGRPHRPTPGRTFRRPR